MDLLLLRPFILQAVFGESLVPPFRMSFMHFLSVTTWTFKVLLSPPCRSRIQYVPEMDYIQRLRCLRCVDFCTTNAAHIWLWLAFKVDPSVAHNWANDLVVLTTYLDVFLGHPNMRSLSHRMPDGATSASMSCIRGLTYCTTELMDLFRWSGSN